MTFVASSIVGLSQRPNETLLEVHDDELRLYASLTLHQNESDNEGDTFQISILLCLSIAQNKGERDVVSFIRRRMTMNIPGIQPSR